MTLHFHRPFLGMLIANRVLAIIAATLAGLGMRIADEVSWN